MELFEGPAEAYVTAWRHALEAGTAPAPFAAGARRIHGIFRAWARLFPIGAPSSMLLEGRIRQLEGNATAARTAFEKAVARGHALSTVLHEAQGWLCLADVLPEGTERSHARARARSLLATTGAEHLTLA